jgi:hypothetical protein
MATVQSTIVRTFYQMGLGYGVVAGTPGNIDLHIDEQLIYSGDIPGVPDPLPGYNPPPAEPPAIAALCSWPVDIDFMGPVAMSIQVRDCTLMLSVTMSNYQELNGDHAAILPIDYTQVIDGFVCQDPFTNVRMNGVPLTRGVAPPAEDGTTNLTGQWTWQIPADCLFEATLNIEPGWL